MKGKIVLIKFPFTNLSSSKRRPALVICERNLDVVVAFITNHIPNHIADEKVIIRSNHREFPLTGLKCDSAIYLDKIATIEKSLISGELGEIGPLLTSEINEKLKRLFRV